MRKLLIGAAATLAIAGCGDINVTSNDAGTQNALDRAEATARDIGNEAGALAEDAGNGLQDLGNRIDNVDIDINTNTAAGNRQ